MRKILSFFLTSFLIIGFIFPVSALKVRDITDTMKQDASWYSYYDAIVWGYESAIFDGFQDEQHKGMFLPTNSITRAEFLKMLFNARKIDVPSSYNKSCFKDSQANIWYNKFLCFSKENGYVRGYDNGTFKPNDTVTIAEAYKILVNAYKFTPQYDIMGHVFSSQRSATMLTNTPLLDLLRINGYAIDTSKWFYPHLSIAHNMGIRFDSYFSKIICDSGYKAENTPTYCSLTRALDGGLSRGQMINLIYQFESIAQSKNLGDSFLTALKNKDGVSMYNAMDNASKNLEGSVSRIVNIIQNIPMQVVAFDFKGAYFYNGLRKPKAYLQDGTEFDTYQGIDGTTYSRNAVKLGYSLSIKLGDGSSPEVVTIDFYPVFVLENGEWKLHEEENRFYKILTGEKVSSSCKNAGINSIYGFMGHFIGQTSGGKICKRGGEDIKKNVIDTIGSSNYAIYAIYDYVKGGSSVYPLGNSYLNIPKIGDIWNDGFNSHIQ